MIRWRPPRTGGRRVAAGLALLIAVGSIIAIALGAGSSSPSRAAADASDSSSATSTVRRRNLVETDTESGTLGHADPQTVYNRLSGTITWLPPVGQVIKPGQALFRVAGQPIILMNGTTPAYRDLGPSDSDAQDVLQLNRNLVALGFNPRGIVVDDAWQAATTAGVDALQAWLSEPETGTLKLGQVVFLPGERLVSSVGASLGSQAELRTMVPAPRFVTLTTTQTTPQRATPGRTRASHHHAKNTNTNTLAALFALLKAETAQLTAAEAQLRATQSNANRNGGGSGSGGARKEGGNPAPARPKTPGKNNDSSGNPGSGNGGGGSATAILATSSTQLVVTVALDPSKQSEATVGRHVAVRMPTGTTVSGRISAVSPVAQSPTDNTGNGGGGNGTDTNGSGSSTTVPVTITLRGHPSGTALDQASVSVDFVRARAKHVLSVPVTALLATQGGRYALQAAASPHGLIPVTTGLFAAGYVEISGRGIHPGLVVADSQG